MPENDNSSDVEEKLMGVQTAASDTEIMESRASGCAKSCLGWLGYCVIALRALSARGEGALDEEIYQAVKRGLEHGGDQELNE